MTGWQAALLTVVSMVTGVGIWEGLKALWRREKPFDAEDALKELRRNYHDVKRGKL